MRTSLKAGLRIAMLTAWATVAASAAEPRVFFDATACVASGVYSPADCRRAERNARAEFDEKAPRFGARSACERAFTHCMIGELFAGGGVAFVPRPRGFAILSGPRPSVLPILESASARMFERRPIDRDETGVRRGKTPSRASPPARAENVNVEQPAERAKAFPVPEALLRDLEARERRFGVESQP